MVIETLREYRARAAELDMVIGVIESADASCGVACNAASQQTRRGFPTSGCCSIHQPW